MNGRHPKPVRKICVVTLSNVGDVVLTLPVFEALRLTYPDAAMDAIVGASGAKVLDGHPWLRQVTIYEKRRPWSYRLGLIRGMRAERYDLVIDLRRSVFGLFGGARLTGGYAPVPKKIRHSALRHLASVKNLISNSTFAAVSGGDRSRFLEFYKNNAVLKKDPAETWVVAAVGSKADIKKWPAAFYAVVLDRLAMERKARIILIGDGADAADAQSVADAMAAPVTNLVGQTDFRQLVSVISQADLLMTNDSAPLHVGDLMHVPTLAVFGPTDPRKYGPRFGRSLVARKITFCMPCEAPQCRFRHECMRDLSAHDVYTQACRALDLETSPKTIRILAIRLDRIGDLVLSLPAIGAIRARFPKAYLAVATRPETSELLEGHPWIDEVIPYHYAKKGRHSGMGNFRFIEEIRKRAFDVCFVFHPSHRSHWVPFLAGIPYRIGFNAMSDAFLLTKRIPNRCHQGQKHESEYILDLVRAFGLEATRQEAFMPVYADEALAAQRRMKEAGFGPSHRVIAVHAGASCPSKRWPLERFEQICRDLTQADEQIRVLVVGGRDERPLGQALKQALGSSCVDWTDQLSLRELAAVLKQCALLLSNDSGPVHVASAVGTRTVTIFGRNEPGLSSRRWKALGPNNRIVQKDVGCVKCLAHRCTIDFECLRAVTENAVLAEVRASLESEPVCA